ncbi:uncharacterized protein L969DRAFT_95982 [Mixia osmundae IAM 14324]|uniref:peptidylprolyl isomerase n=1 Tax=Mixia osmundae (strain CBS 9802 / IAM 14324 / JCM 22182 / KY 12970) TaxID=764103 RepID=G7DWU5_MIXOS|nr:uncharacterized protein L969DRAFT_97527 [Mixia osmundae IAM 14324]XP_014566712.1 uncharacterized protein L969DRAFT_95982 [Mixia osmundae IAM 14324]KEI36181.1 hypothetical protein L969DRAFT_97527 [Mixia osmundae IAM 14324]KEI38149.1 hypothetical protein L969DRAFT_95982 [Mixia osmundae IAM 14324]GAA95042.1 hypothetical protein E5Q_01697 [Mixia osmundae IAM 14324]
MAGRARLGHSPLDDARPHAGRSSDNGHTPFFRAVSDNEAPPATALRDRATRPASPADANQDDDVVMIDAHTQKPTGDHRPRVLKAVPVPYVETFRSYERDQPPASSPIEQFPSQSTRDRTPDPSNQAQRRTSDGAVGLSGFEPRRLVARPVPAPTVPATIAGLQPRVLSPMPTHGSPIASHPAMLPSPSQPAPSPPPLLAESSDQNAMTHMKTIQALTRSLEAAMQERDALQKENGELKQQVGSSVDTAPLLEEISKLKQTLEETRTSLDKANKAKKRADKETEEFRGIYQAASQAAEEMRPAMDAWRAKAERLERTMSAGIAMHVSIEAGRADQLRDELDEVKGQNKFLEDTLAHVHRQYKKEIARLRDNNRNSLVSDLHSDPVQMPSLAIAKRRRIMLQTDDDDDDDETDSDAEPPRPGLLIRQPDEPRLPRDVATLSPVIAQSAVARSADRHNGDTPGYLDEHVQSPYICEMIPPGGQVCGQRFADEQALDLHLDEHLNDVFDLANFWQVNVDVALWNLKKQSSASHNMSHVVQGVWSQTFTPEESFVLEPPCDIQITTAILLPQSESGAPSRSVLTMRYLDMPAEEDDIGDSDESDDEELDSDEMDILEAAAEEAEQEAADDDALRSAEATVKAAIRAKRANGKTANGKGSKVQDDDEEEDEDSEEEESDEDADIDEEDEEEADYMRELDERLQETVLCSLKTDTNEQVNLNLILPAGSPYIFSVAGDNAITLLGHYIRQIDPYDYDRPPYDSDEDSEGLYDSDIDSDEEIDSDEMGVYDDEEGLALEGDSEEEDEMDEDSRFEEVSEDDVAALAAEQAAAAKKSSPKKPVAVAVTETIITTPTAAEEDADASTASAKLSKNARKKQARREKEAAAQALLDKDKETKTQTAAADAKALKATTKAVQEKEDAPKAEAKVPTKAEPTKIKLPSGLIIEDTKVGQGPKAVKGKKIGMRYIGRLANGKVFDKNVSGKTFEFKLGKGQVIKGWDEGIAGMQLGGERKLSVPPALAYGRSGTDGIPANAWLNFEVKLVSMK